MADTLDLLVTAIESVVPSQRDGSVNLRVQLKGQRPEDECLLEFPSSPEFLRTLHDAKKRGGTVWVRFNLWYPGSRIRVDERGQLDRITSVELVVRDVLE